MRMMMMRVRVLLDGGKSWHKEAWMSHTRLRQDVTPRHSWAATSEESHHQAGVTKCNKVTQVVTLVLPSLKNWRLKNDIHGRELEPLKEEKPLQSMKKAQSTKVRFNTRDKKKLNCIHVWTRECQHFNLGGASWPWQHSQLGAQELGPFAPQSCTRCMNETQELIKFAGISLIGLKSTGHLA